MLRLRREKLEPVTSQRKMDLAEHLTVQLEKRGAEELVGVGERREGGRGGPVTDSDCQ